jgi:hypothetical protein
VTTRGSAGAQITGATVTRRRDGFPDIGALAPLGDGRSLVLVGPDAGVEFWCPMRFDAPALVFPLLDRHAGGRLRFGPVEATGAPLPCRRRYAPDSAVVEVEWEGHWGAARMRMALTWPPPEQGQELLWLLEGVDGAVEVQAVLSPRPAFGAQSPQSTVDRHLASVTAVDLSLLLATSGIALQPVEGGAVGREVLHAGQRWAARLRIGADTPSTCGADPDEVAADIDATDAAWRNWAAGLSYTGPRPDAVVRSAMTLKQLIYTDSGAVTAAATLALPEQVGGVRNWDYRYTWLRDASFTLNALYQLNCREEANAYARWLCRTTAAAGLPLRVLYRIDGGTDIPESTLDHLTGYRDSRPVRVGNAAETQLQLDSYGELLDCLTICEVFDDQVMRTEWPHFRRLVDFTAEHWAEPDSGIWEVRSHPRHFVHSKALAWTALDRGCRLIEAYDLPGDYRRWQQAADACKAQVYERGVVDGHFVRAYDDPTLDASLLMLPLVGFVPGDHPVMLATLDTLREQLSPPGAVHPGLLWRYALSHPDSSGDGLPGTEGAFAIASFWLVEALALAGRQDEATALFTELVDLGGDLGTFAEEIDPTTGGQLGNTPQAFTHIGLINAALRLAGASAKGARRPPAEPDGCLKRTTPAIRKESAAPFAGT